MALSNDAYADYALNLYGKYKAWSGSVSNAASPKFARAYTYDELVQLGQRALSDGAGGQMDSEENIRKYIAGLQADYDKQVQSVFTSGSRAGQESTVARYINGGYSYSTPSQDTANKLSALNNLINPDYQSPLVKNHLRSLATQDFDGRQGFIDKPQAVVSEEIPQENASQVSSIEVSLSNYNKNLDTYNQKMLSFDQRLTQFPKSKQFSPLQHINITR